MDYCMYILKLMAFKMLIFELLKFEFLFFQLLVFDLTTSTCHKSNGLPIDLDSECEWEIF